METKNEGIFIKEFNNKYKIFPTGEIISLYRFANNGKKINTFIRIKFRYEPKTKQYQCDLSSKTFNLKTLFKEYFNLKPPNNYQKFTLEFKKEQGNFNLNNLYFKPLLLSKTNFSPEIVVNKNNEPIQKKCVECGKIKDIKFFIKQVNQNLTTFRNKCNTCRKDNLLFEVKNNPDKRKTYLEYQRKRRNLEHVKEYHKQYDKEYRKTLPKNYVAHILRIPVTELPESLYKLKKEQIILTKKLKNEKC